MDRVGMSQFVTARLTLVVNGETFCFVALVYTTGADWDIKISKTNLIKSS